MCLITDKAEGAARAAIAKAKKTREPAHIGAALYKAFDKGALYEEAFINELALAAAGLRPSPVAPGSYLPSCVRMPEAVQ